MTKLQNHAFLAERLESRQLLSASVQTLAIGSVLYSAQSSGTASGGSDLYRSNLDGTGKTLLGHWDSGDQGPANLFAYGSKLLFSADYQANDISGPELWVSDGTAGGTKMIADLYEIGTGSYPREFHLVNGHAVFLANNNSPSNVQLYSTDGTSAGTVMISPARQDGYYGGVANASFTSTAITWDYDNENVHQVQRLSSDGTGNYRVLYTEPTNGVITIGGYGSTATNIAVSTTGDGTIRVTQDGTTLDFRSTDVQSIDLTDSFAADTITVDPAVTVPVLFHTVGGNDTITGGGGTNTLDVEGHFKSVETDGNVTGVEAATVTLSDNGGTATFINGDTVTLHGVFTHILGGNGNDTLIGTSRAETLEGGGGDDLIVGNGGGDSLDGGAGHDTITGSHANDQIIADANDTVVNTDPGNQQGGGSTGSSDDDHVHYALTNGVLRVYGTSGDDNLKFVGSASSIKLMLNGTTSKVLASKVRTIVVYGGAGDDVIQLSNLSAMSKLYGEAGNDAIVGSFGKDRIYGGDGDDSLAGGDNHDTLYGEAGDDRVFGGASSDYVSGGAGTNVIRGEGGFDHIVYASGDDVRGNRGDKMEIDSIVG